MKFITGTFPVSLMLMCAPLALWAAPAAVRSVRFIPAEKVLHLEVALSQPAAVHVFRLAHPSRIVLDFEAAQMKAPLTKTGLPLPGVQSLRVGHPKKGVLRLVLDVDNAIRYQQRSLSKSDRLSLDLFPFAGVAVRRKSRG